MKYSGNDLPKISIITPSYNQGQFIEETILSVIDQDYPNVEYIIMDGGSTDDTLSVIEKYTDKIAYWESKQDKGQSHAINKGFKMASGKYVGWLNSDDYLEPGVLKHIIAGFRDENIGTVCGRMKIVDETGKKLSERFNEDEITSERLLSGGVQVNQPGTFHRKNLLEKYGYLDEDLNYVMDYELWIRLGKHSKFKQTDEVIANHRFHETSKTVAEFINFIPEIKKVRKKYGGKFFCKRTLSIARVELWHWGRKLFGR